MEPTRRPYSRQRTRRPSLGTVLVALLAGIVVLFALFPASGIDTDPPVCFAAFGYVVPCEGWVAPLAAVVTAVVVGSASWMGIDRRR